MLMQTYAKKNSCSKSKGGFRTDTSGILQAAEFWQKFDYEILQKQLLQNKV